MQQRVSGKSDTSGSDTQERYARQRRRRSRTTLLRENWEGGERRQAPRMEQVPLPLSEPPATSLAQMASRAMMPSTRRAAVPMQCLEEQRRIAESAFGRVKEV